MNTGQVFMFNKENCDGHYGKDIVELFYTTIKKLQLNGRLTLYAGDSIASGYTEYCVGILLMPPRPYDFWKQIDHAIQQKIAKDIPYYGIEPTSKAALQAAYYLYQGTFIFENGIAVNMMAGQEVDSWTLAGCIIDDQAVHQALRDAVEKERDGRL